MATKLLMVKSPDEAIAARTETAVFLAGGTEVNRLGSEAAAGAETLISLKKCDGLKGIEEDGGCVKIGSMCTFQDLVESEAVPAYLREAALFMASRTKRNMATIGGNIAVMRDDSYLLPVLFAVCAEVEVLTTDGTSRMCVNSFKEESEAGKVMLITSVIVPKDAKVVSKRYANTAQSHAVLTMSAACGEKGITLAAAVKNSGLYRFKAFEKALKEGLNVTEEDIMGWFSDNLKIPMQDDMFGGTAYKRYLISYTAFDLCRQLTDEAVKEVQK